MSSMSSGLPEPLRQLRSQLSRPLRLRNLKLMSSPAGQQVAQASSVSSLSIPPSSSSSSVADAGPAASSSLAAKAVGGAVGLIAVLRGGFQGAASASATSQGWLYLTLCILLEVLATSSMKVMSLTNDKRWYLAIYGGYFACFSLFPLAVKRLPSLSVAYATWCGAGTVLTFMVGARFFGEAVSPMKVLFLALTTVGIVGLNMVGGGSH